MISGASDLGSALIARIAAMTEGEQSQKRPGLSRIVFRFARSTQVAHLPPGSAIQ